jgi:hypothetical protein
VSGQRAPALRRRARRVAPLSFAQERLWFVDAASPGSVTYNVPLFVRWTEAVDTGALAYALGAVAARHEVLRTTYRVADGRPVQVVHDPGRVPLEIVDLTDVADPSGHARRDAERRAREPFDLARRAPVRCAVWQGLPGGDAMLLCVHHIAVDGWSLAALFEDLADAYAAAVAGEPPGLPELPVQYADFAAWDRALFAEPTLQRQLAARVDDLAGVPGDLTLGGRRPSPPAAEGARPGAQYVFGLPAALWSRVGALAAELRATPFVVLFAAFQVVVQRWSGRDDFVLGTVTANRPHPDLEALIGFFVNTVPLRCDPRPDLSFRQLCGRARAEAFRSLTYQRIPYDRLAAAVRAARPAPAGGHGALVDIGFALQNMPTADVSGTPRWRTPVVLPTGTAKFDLILTVEEGPGGVVGTVEYATDCYPAEVGRELGENFRTLLAAAVDDPDRGLSALPITPRSPGVLPPSVLVGARRDLVAERMARLTGGTG